jgi:hypothetical protein
MPVRSISRRDLLGAAIAGAAGMSTPASGRTNDSIGTNPPLPARVSNVNTTSIRAAVELGCQTMSMVFNRDDNEIPFFASEVWPTAELSFYQNHTESHVPGRHLNALLTAESILGTKVDEAVIEKHTRGAFFSYSGSVPLPLNRTQIGGPLDRFLPHNLREGFHALYALVRYRNSAKARELAERSIACIGERWDPQRGWDVHWLETTAGLKVIEWNSPFITGIARAIGPLVKYYRATGYAPALQLALLLSEKATDEFYFDGTYSSQRFGTHVHSTTCVLSSLAQLADLLCDAGLLRKVDAFYSNGLNAISDGIGWSIENSSPSSVPDRGEANNTGDILETSLILGASGFRGYFARAERILTCHLLPCQLRDVSFIKQPDNPRNEDGKRDVAQRHLGAFGFPAPYGHMPLGVKDISFNMDIVGGAVGSLCEAYRSVASATQAGHRVNLLVDHESDSVKVLSPYTHDSLQITVHKPGPLFVRIPQWVDRSQLQLESAPGHLQFHDEYLFIGQPSIDKPIRITFPINSTELVLDHRTRHIRAKLRGDRIAAMDNFGAPLAYFDPI